MADKKMVGGLVPLELAEKFGKKVKENNYQKVEVLRVLMRRYTEGKIDITAGDVIKERHNK